MVTPDDDVLAVAESGACEPDRVSVASTVSTIAVSTHAPAARAPMVMRALRLRAQKRLPHLWQR
jgi:hypothetical protein